MIVSEFVYLVALIFINPLTSEITHDALKATHTISTKCATFEIGFQSLV